MATLSSTYLNLIDVHKQNDPRTGEIIEVLKRQNPILDDAVAMECNMGATHRHTIRTGLPEPTWRQFYGGVQPTKSTRAQVQDNTAMMEAYAEIDKALADLNAMVHPAVGSEIANRLAAAADAPVPAGATAPIVVLDVPLLVETGRSDVAAVIVVDTHPDVQMHRLVNQRGLDAADAAARMARQATRQQRLDRADHVIDNTSDLDHLRAETDRVWTQLCELQASSDS
jgi:dephospho-CoA kinase